MTLRRSIGLTAIALLFSLLPFQPLDAQVVEDRDSEANPASAIFRSTMYGLGTGVVLGGTYALIDRDEDWEDALRWGAAIGASAGLVIGLIHVATRSEPEDDEGMGMIRYQDGNVRFSAAGVLAPHVRHLPDGRLRVLDVHLLSARF